MNNILNLILASAKLDKGLIWKVVISGVVVAVLFVVLIYVYQFFKGIRLYTEDMNDHLVKGTREIYSRIQVKDGKYLPYYYTHGYCVMHKFGAGGMKCELTGFSTKKNYALSPEKVLYIVNNNPKYPFKIVELEGRKYIELNDEIKTMTVLFSFGLPAHLLYKLEFSKENDEYKVKVIEEDIPGERNRNKTPGSLF